MTKEEKDLKDLLLKDICARLPYGVKIHIGKTQRIEAFDDINLRIGSINNTYADIKPYLFPLSSMTPKQKAELKDLGWTFDNFEIHNVSECIGAYREYVAHLDCFELIDWLNKNHFDYRGLIKKSLAIDATNLNVY